MTFLSVQMDLVIIWQVIVHNFRVIAEKINMFLWILSYLEEDYLLLIKLVTLDTIMEMMENLLLKLVLQINLVWLEAGSARVATRTNFKIQKIISTQVEKKNWIKVKVWHSLELLKDQTINLIIHLAIFVAFYIT
jgi:hypothetical protein